MRIALYSLIFLGTVLLVLDLTKLVEGIEPQKKAAAQKSTPVETHGSQDPPKQKSAESQPAGHPDIDQALALYTQAIEKSPTKAAPYASRGNAYIANKDYEKAVTDYDQAIKIEPENIDYLLQRGALFLNLNQSDKAITDFTHVLKIDPDRTKALAYRAFIYYRNKQHQEALNDCLMMLEKDSTFTDLHTTIAQCYKALDQDDKAIFHLELYIQSTKDTEGKKKAEALLKEWTPQP